MGLRVLSIKRRDSKRNGSRREFKKSGGLFESDEGESRA